MCGVKYSECEKERVIKRLCESPQEKKKKTETEKGRKSQTESRIIVCV